MYSNNRIQTNSSSSSSSFQTTTTRTTTTTTSSNLVRPSFNQQPVEPQETNYYTQPARKELSSSNKQHLPTSLSQPPPQTRPAAVANDPNMPDLSHLSEDERKIIEAVLARQKAEEEMDSKLSQLNPTPYR